MAEGEGESSEWLEGERVVRSQGGQVAPADPTDRGLDPDPVGSRKLGHWNAVERDRAEWSESKARPTARQPTGQDITYRSERKPDRVQSCVSVKGLRNRRDRFGSGAR